MDKERTKKKPSFFESALGAVRGEAARRKNERGALIIDIAVFLSAFFFARRHIVFGAYPLAAALVAALPTRVWIALIGAVGGSLSLGKSGIIHAGVALIILFLRIIISTSNKASEDSALFGEPLIMRLSAATIGAFVGAGYEMLLSGFSFSSILFGVFGVGLTLGFTFIYSGLFFTDIPASDFLFGGEFLQILVGKRQVVSLDAVFVKGESQFFFFGSIFRNNGQVVFLTAVGTHDTDIAVATRRGEPVDIFVSPIIFTPNGLSIQTIGGNSETTTRETVQKTGVEQSLSHIPMTQMVFSFGQ